MSQLQHENLTCALLPDGTVEITGYTGPQDPGWERTTVVDIPERIDGRPVTSIGPEAFRDVCVRRIVLPDGLRRIGEYAFCACCFTEPLVIPDSVEVIGKLAFYRIGGMVENPIPASLRYIASCGYAGSGVTGTLVLPETLQFIGEKAFAWNTRLTGLVLPACAFRAEADALMGVEQLTVHPGSAGEAIALASPINPHSVRRL